MKQCLVSILCLMLMLSHSSCYKPAPAPAPEEIKSQEEITNQEEVELPLENNKQEKTEPQDEFTKQEAAELAQRINEQHPFSFQAPAVKTYWYDAERIWYGLEGDWAYYTSYKDGEKWICRSRLDGSDKTWIASLEYPRDAYWFVVYEDWIFFLEFAAPKSRWGRLYRINQDGTQKTPMEEIYANSLYLQDGWLYYTDYGAVGRMRPDGSAHEKVIEKDGLYQSFLAEDWLYVSVARGGGGSWSHVAPLELYRVHISGSPVIRLDNDELNPSGIQVSGDWVYFQNWQKDQNLYRVPTKGGKAENLFENKEFVLGNYDSYYVAGDWIVFTQRKLAHQASVVYRMLTDGSYVEMITDSLPASIGAGAMMFSRGYLSSSEKVRGSEGSIGKTHLTLFKLDDEGQLHTIASLEADNRLNILAIHENGVIYEIATKGDYRIRWISLEPE